MGKIFILEDDNDIREIVELILIEEDYAVVSFASIRDFMNRSSDEIPDLFILDVRLPDGSGLDICNQLKAAAESANTPIIMMSAHANLEQVGILCDADSFIHKPFDINEFIAQVRDQVKK